MSADPAKREKGAFMSAMLDRADIAARIPHAGSMCLLDRVLAWSSEDIHCTARSHADAGNPLRSASGLPSASAIEYAAQAMAVHGALVAQGDEPPQPGFLASVRSVELHVPRLDDIDGELQVHARRLAGDARQVMYEFELRAQDERLLARGRAVVVLNTPLAPDAVPSNP